MLDMAGKIRIRPHSVMIEQREGREKFDEGIVL